MSKVLLGTKTKSASPLSTKMPKNGVKDARAMAYKMQQTAQHLLPARHRIGVCHRLSVLSDGHVSIYRQVESGKLRYGGLMTCGAGWLCPVCAARISMRRRKQLAFIAGRVMALGYKVVLLTYTLRHTDADELDTTLKILSESYRSTKSGKVYQRLKNDYKILGSIRTLEITVGQGAYDGGWHPHIHEMLFFKSGDAEELGAEFYDRYAAAVRRRGGDLDRKHGLTVVTADESVAAYVAKWGHIPLAEWSLAHEMGGTIKTGRSKGRRSIWKLLYDCAVNARLVDQKLWKEYATVIHGHRQILISPDVKALVGVEDIEDDVAAYDADMEKDEVLLFNISAEAWLEACKKQLRGRVLDLADGVDLATFSRRMTELLGGMVVHMDLSGSEAVVTYSSGIT